MNGNGITIQGSELQHWNTHIIENNTVNNKPLYYFKNQTGGEVPENAGQIILANSTGMIIENLSISNTDVGIELGFSSQNIVRNNNITNNHYWGISLWYSSNNMLMNNNVSNNDDFGISLDDSSNNMLMNNSVSNNYFGISLDDSSNNTLMNNSVSNNYFGIYLDDSSNNMLMNNNVSNNGWCGIGLADSSNNMLMNNNVSNNDDCGIYPYHSSNNMLINNNVLNNGWCGIFLADSSNNMLINNNVLNNDRFGIDLADSSNNLLYHNNFIGNGQNAYDECNNQWDNGAEGNYWDDYTGTDENGDGIGDTPYYIPGGNNKDNYPLMNPFGGNQPELSISPSDITFLKDEGTTVINADIHNFGQIAFNIRYWIIDNYNNKETLIENNVIPFIDANSYESISKTVYLENPENHKIKVIVDPNNDIEESNEGNNVAARYVFFGEGYVLTSVSYGGRAYNVMVTVKPSYSFQKIKTLFDDKKPSFAYGIKKIWVVDARNPSHSIPNNNNIIGNILYNIANGFKQSPPYYPYSGYYHNVENAEIVANTVRNRWLFDLFSISHWFDELTGGHDKDEVLELWDYVINGPINRYVPESNPVENLIGGTFAILSLASTAKANWNIDFETLGSENAYDMFAEFLKKSVIKKGNWKLNDMYIKYYNPNGDFDYIYWKPGGYMIPEDATPAYKEFIKFLNNNDFYDLVTKVCEYYSKDVITLEDFHSYYVEQANARLNKLQVLRDIINLYNPNDEILTEFDDAIKLAKINVATLKGYVEPDNTFDWKKHVVDPLFDAVAKTAAGYAFEETVKFALQHIIADSITTFIGPEVTLGSIGTVSASTIAGYATAVLAGWDLGLTLCNWGEVSRYADIAKLNMHMGHYVVDTPTFILSKDFGRNNEAMYSSIVSSLKESIIGSGYYNMGMSREKLWFGLTGWFGWGDDWEDAGAVCYSKSEFTDADSLVFPLFNYLCALYEAPNYVNEKDIPMIPSMKNSLSMDSVTTTKYLMNVGSLDGGLRFYCTNFDLKLDVIVTKIGNKYVITINPFEMAHGLLGGSERVEQIDNQERMKYRIYSESNVIASNWDSMWDYTNLLHNFLWNQKWYESPRTMYLPSQPTSMDIRYQWYENVMNLWGPRWIEASKSFSLNTIEDGLLNNEESVTKTYIYPILQYSSTRGNISYSTWDSNSDGFDDAVTVNWNLSGFQDEGKIIVSSYVIGGNNSGNASTEARYFTSPFMVTDNNSIFSFDFFANETMDCNIYLYVLNATNLTIIDDENLMNISLFEGPGDLSSRESFVENTSTVLDTNADMVTDTFNMNLSMNSTSTSGVNCSLIITCVNETRVVVDINSSLINLNQTVINVSYSISPSEPGGYMVSAYLSDENHYLEDLYIQRFTIGKNVSHFILGVTDDFGNDSDNDGKYDFLSFEIELNISQSANYSIIGFLHNTSGVYIGRTGMDTFLTTGQHMVSLDFNSSLIAFSGENQTTFILTGLSILNETGFTLETCSPNYMTGLYNISDFEQPPIVVYSNITGFGVDSDEDGYFNQLQVNVTVNAIKPGRYSFNLQLTNTSGDLSIFSVNSSNVSIGFHALHFLFDGFALRKLAQNTTLRVKSVEVYRNNNLIGKTYPNCSIGFYNYTEFQPLLFIEDNYTDTGVDSDNDGLFDYLEITADVNVIMPGNYSITGDLYSLDNTLIDSFSSIENLTDPSENISLLFNGSSVFRTFNETSYYLKNLVITHLDTGHIADSRENATVTQIYNYTSFEPCEISDCYAVSDEGVDEDNDGSYDYLLVNISVDVNIAGNYTIRGYLCDANSSFICMASNWSTYDIGSNSVPLLFSGQIINQAGSNGNYSVPFLQVFDENNVLVYVKNDEYITNCYNSSMFDEMLYPDLKISGEDISFKENPEENGTILVTANVSNTGDTNVSGVVVEFREGDSLENSSLINDVMIPFVNSSGYALVSVIWCFSGNYTVYVVVDPFDDVVESNESNNQASAVLSPFPVADFNYEPHMPTVSDVIQFTDLSYDLDGFIVNWTWDFGDGNISYERNPTHQYGSNGTYNVTLTVIDDDGLIDSVSEDITIFAFFTYNLSLYSGWRILSLFLLRIAGGLVR